ncbi:MAG: ABC transporter permease [Dehalococcoidia bacterium]|nr:ABC transporter permease [Dehalococcoidia bacterium]
MSGQNNRTAHSMTTLLWVSGLRHLLRHPWQMALSVLGITLGVAIVVAIDLGNQSAKRAFSLSSDAVAGRATHQIIGGPGGLPEDIYTMLRVELGIRDSAPLVEGHAYLEDERVLRILGMDPFADSLFRPYTVGNSPDGDPNDTTRHTFELLATPATGLMSVGTADSLGLRAGDTITLDISGLEQQVRIVGLIAPQNSLSREMLQDLLITDISTAQELTAFEGRLSHIDLIVPPNEEGRLVLERISAALPPETSVVTPSARSDAIEQLTVSFDQNLFMISLLGLIVGAFLIYNAMTFSVVQRRPVIGSLRALGVTRQQIFALVLGEAAIVGLISSVIGVLLGIVIGRGLVDLITQTITDLFFVVSVQDLSIPVWSLVKGALLGIAATLGAAFVPALEATGVPAREALSRSHIETRFKGTVPLASIIGLVVIAVGCGLVLLPVNTLLLPFLGLAALILGGAMLTPVSVILFSRALAPVLGRMFGSLGALAARGIAASISRTAVAIAALSVAISVTISIDTMVHSFRDTVEEWLESSLGSDIYISPASLRSYRTGVELFPGVL